MKFIRILAICLSPKIIKIVINSHYWSQAFYYSGSDEYQTSFNYLNKYEKNSKDIGLKPTSEFYVRKGFLLSALGHKKEALTLLTKSVDHIKAKSTVLNKDEKCYLCNYATYIAGINDYHEEPFGYDDNYVEANVAEHLKTKYPYTKGKRPYQQKVLVRSNSNESP